MACSVPRAAAWRCAPSRCCRASRAHGRKLAAACNSRLVGPGDCNRATLDRPDLMQNALGRPARVVNMVELGKALNSLADPPVKAPLCLQLESRGRVSRSQRSHPRLAPPRPVHRRARAVFHRHDRLCRHHPSRDHLLRAKGFADRLRPLLPSDVEPGD